MQTGPVIIWISPFLILGISGGFSHFYCSLRRNSWRPTVLNFIRCCNLRHLNWVYTVFLCPLKKSKMGWVDESITEILVAATHRILFDLEILILGT